MSDEPVAYLGGDQGEAPPPDDPPPDASAGAGGGGDPGVGGDEEVDGYLGGASGEEELPSLPAAESTGTFTSKDFLPSDVEAPTEDDDPYADPYAQQPAEGYGDYEGYDAAAVEQSDPAYFDSMGHGTSGEAAPPAEDYSTDAPVDDPDQPKTISQQDAESIIRRITTKRILPPDSGEAKKPVAPPPPKLTEAGGGLRIWPILFVVVVVGGMAVFFFGEQIAQQFPEARPYLFWLDPPPPTVTEDKIDRPDPNKVAKEKMLQMVLLSEAKAFGVNVKDVPAAAEKSRSSALDADPPVTKGGSTSDGGTSSGGGGQ